MFAKLLQLAADKKLIVGMCVHPPGTSGYQVEIWTGPSMGERKEWYERFPCDIPQLEALDRVAEIAAHDLAQVWRRSVVASAFFQPTPHHDRVEPNVSRAAAGPDKQRAARIASSSPPGTLAIATSGKESEMKIKPKIGLEVESCRRTESDMSVGARHKHAEMKGQGLNQYT